MQTIHVSADFPLNRRMRKAVRRGKLHVVRDGGERSGLGGGDGGDDNGPLWVKSILSVTAHGNATDYLKMAVRALVELRDNPYAWKWALISLHGAIYGFAVCAVACDDGGRNVLKGGKLNGHLLDFWRVIKICKDEKQMNRYGYSRPLVLSDEQERALKGLCDYRNQAAHFPPNLHDGWFPGGELVIHCLEVVRMIALFPRNRKSVDEKQNVEALCAAGIELARNYIIPADGE